MLPEAGATELIFLAAVALIVVGPKDLPILLRKVGQFTAKMRALAAEFRSSFDELARQSELDELRREVDALRRGDYSQPVRQSLNEIDSHFESLHRELGAPPPSGFGDRADEIVAGPDAQAHHTAEAAAAELVLPKPEAPSAELAVLADQAQAAGAPAEPLHTDHPQVDHAKIEQAAPHASDPAAPVPPGASPGAPHASEHAG
jgi:sec-independent protein translocase protein TatB